MFKFPAKFQISRKIVANFEFTTEIITNFKTRAEKTFAKISNFPPNQWEIEFNFLAKIKSKQISKFPPKLKLNQIQISRQNRT